MKLYDLKRLERGPSNRLIVALYVVGSVVLKVTDTFNKLSDTEIHVVV